MNTSYEGGFSHGYFVVRAPTYRNPAFFRVFVENGDVAAAVHGVKENFRLYPLAQAGNPPNRNSSTFPGCSSTLYMPNDFEFEEMNAIIQYEPADAFDSEILGLFASVNDRCYGAFSDRRNRATL